MAGRRARRHGGTRPLSPLPHRGSSILPSSLPILEFSWGPGKKIEARDFQVKRGVYFQWEPTNGRFISTSLGDKTAYAWQVTRSDFDQILLDNARSLGVDVNEGVTVRELRFDGDRPVAATWAPSQGDGPGGEISFDYLIDASGRGGVMANRYLRNRRFHEMFRNVAGWCYWKGAERLAAAPRAHRGLLGAQRLVLGHPAARRHDQRGTGDQQGPVQRAAQARQHRGASTSRPWRSARSWPNCVKGAEQVEGHEGRAGLLLRCRDVRRARLLAQRRRRLLP